MEANSTISIYVNPVLGLTLALEKQMEQIRQAQDFLAKQYAQTISLAFKSPLVELTKNIQKMHENMAKSLLFAMNPFAQTYPAYTDVQEAEIIEQDDLFGLTVSIEGRFFWNGELVGTISTNSKHGKLLKMLLEAEGNYVTDNKIIKILDVSIDKGVGYLRRDMKKALGEYGLKMDLYREKETGYKLLGINRLLN